MSEEEYLAHFVKLLITLEDENDTPSIGVQMKHLLSESIIAERNTDYLPIHKFVAQYDLELQRQAELEAEEEKAEEFRIKFDNLKTDIFSDDELKSIMAGGEDE